MAKVLTDTVHKWLEVIKELKSNHLLLCSKLKNGMSLYIILIFIILQFWALILQKTFSVLTHHLNWLKILQEVNSTQITSGNCSVPSTVLSTGDRALNQQGRNSYLHGVYSLTGKKQTINNIKKLIVVYQKVKSSMERKQEGRSNGI